MINPTPKQLKRSVVKPPDFDSYWAATLAASESVPLEPRLDPVSMRSTTRVALFEALYRSYGDLIVAGWYARPAGSNLSDLPGLLFVPGYVSEPSVPIDLASMGYAVFSAAPRGKLRSNNFAVFVYLTDVFPGDGCVILVSGSHKSNCKLYKDFFGTD